MKGAIVDCMKKLIISMHGREKWEKCLDEAGINPKTVFLPSVDVPDRDVLKIIDSICRCLNISKIQLTELFGDYWVNKYAIRVYKTYYKGRNAKEFILNINDIHKSVTKNIKGAMPPKFTYVWKDDQTLIIKYQSHRGLIDFVVGLIKGVGKYYNEELQVSKIGESKVQIKFKEE